MDTQFSAAVGYCPHGQREHETFTDLYIRKTITAMQTRISWVLLSLPLLVSEAVPRHLPLPVPPLGQREQDQQQAKDQTSAPQHQEEQSFWHQELTERHPCRSNSPFCCTITALTLLLREDSKNFPISLQPLIFCCYNGNTVISVVSHSRGYLGADAEWETSTMV